VIERESSDLEGRPDNYLEGREKGLERGGRN